jgi:hypothetical protein
LKIENDAAGLVYKLFHIRVYIVYNQSHCMGEENTGIFFIAGSIGLTLNVFCGIFPVEV